MTKANKFAKKTNVFYHELPKTNRVILQSIPLNRKVKKYWLEKYLRIATNCGIEEAQRKFKNLRQAIMAYRADSDRISNLPHYLEQSGFKQNGQLKMLFAYADTHPHLVLNFLKLYTAPNKPVQTADEAATATYKRLKAVESNDSIPTFLSQWFGILSQTPKQKIEYYHYAKRYDVFGSRYCKHHSLQDWMSYWKKWYSIIKAGWCEDLSSHSHKLVFPEIYKDYLETDNYSSSYESDFADLCSLHMNDHGSGLSPEELDFVDSFLSEEVAEHLNDVLWGEDIDYNDIFSSTTILSGEYVGHIHHIAKKGGGTELRDIAVPNRFIQLALSPGAARLYSILKRLPMDATFNQDKFDTRVQNRVNNDHLYQGSVDLSKATDNLPRSWGFFILKQFSSIFGTLDETEARSLSLFETVASAKWEDEGYLNEWTVGQPLGSLPSFAMLGLTHVFFTESLAFSLGLGHSPFIILGDDIVIFNKKLRKAYIRVMNRYKVPLSLHKSYERNLSEFAGKMYIKNCVPFYCSDHSTMTWESLFDWQRATGIKIPYEHLPKNIKRRLERCVNSCGRSEITSENLSQMASLAYSHAQACLVYGRGSLQFDIKQDVKPELFFEYLYKVEDKQLPDDVCHTGITILGNGHPVVLMNSRFADHNGYFHRYRPVQLPQWYKNKYRPCATDDAINAGLASVVGM